MIAYPTFRLHLHRLFSNDPALDAIPLETILDAIPTADQLRDLGPGTVVLLRCDLDMPIQGHRVADLARIKANSQTIRYCVTQGWRVVIFGHLGRDKTVSVRPVCQAYSSEIGQEIELIPDWLVDDTTQLRDDVVARVGNAPPGSVFMLENTRTYAIEQAMWTATNDTFDSLAAGMYNLARDVTTRLSDVEINEAMAASNFDFSSSVLPLVMRATGLGFYISEELKTHIKGARRATMIVISGLKINKLDDLEQILLRGTLGVVIAAGSLAMALKKAEAQDRGVAFHIGRAETDTAADFYVSPKRLEQARRIVRACKTQGVRLVLPADFVLDTEDVAKIIPPDRIQLDIGPKTRALIADTIERYVSDSQRSNQSAVMFYNGVFGRFEDSRYEAGTREFISHLRDMTRAGVLTYVGGGEGRLALLKYGSLSDVTHAFTAGGTILKCLSDKHVKFLKAMYLQNTSHASGL